MQRLSRLPAFFLPLWVAACGYLIPHHHQSVDLTALAGGAYRVDPDHATLLFKIDHLGFSKLIGRFDRFDASLDFDPAMPEMAKLDVRIETASLDLDLPDFEEELRSSSWFDTPRYPEARFLSTRIERTGDNRGRVIGDLTLHGVTRAAVLDVTFNGGGTNLLTGAYTLGFEATGSLRRSDFGLGRYAPAVGDEVALEIHAEFNRV